MDSVYRARRTPCRERQIKLFEFIGEIMNNVKTTDNLRQLAALMVRLETSTARRRYANVRLQQKWNHLKFAAEDFLDAMRRTN